MTQLVYNEVIKSYDLHTIFDNNYSDSFVNVRVSVSFSNKIFIEKGVIELSFIFRSFKI